AIPARERSARDRVPVVILDPLDPPATLVVLAGALALDRALGEPAARLHPVVWMGWTVNAALRAAPRSARFSRSPCRPRSAGRAGSSSARAPGAACSRS